MKKKIVKIMLICVMLFSLTACNVISAISTVYEATRTIRNTVEAVEQTGAAVWKGANFLASLNPETRREVEDLVMTFTNKDFDYLEVNADIFLELAKIKSLKDLKVFSSKGMDQKVGSLSRFNILINFDDVKDAPKDRMDSREISKMVKEAQQEPILIKTIFSVMHMKKGITADEASFGYSYETNGEKVIVWYANQSMTHMSQCEVCAKNENIMEHANIDVLENDEKNKVMTVLLTMDYPKPEEPKPEEPKPEKKPEKKPEVKKETIEVPKNLIMGAFGTSIKK